MKTLQGEYTHQAKAKMTSMTAPPPNISTPGLLERPCRLATQRRKKWSMLTRVAKIAQTALGSVLTK